MFKNITKKHCDLLKRVNQEDIWRKHTKYTLGIDGFNGSGKSTLARLLSWQTEIPIIEADMLLDSTKGGFNYRQDDLLRLINARHHLNRPVIIEGIFLLQILKSINIAADFLIYVEKVGHEGRWPKKFTEYAARYRPKEIANYVYTWQEPYAEGNP